MASSPKVLRVAAPSRKISKALLALASPLAMSLAMAAPASAQSFTPIPDFPTDPVCSLDTASSRPNTDPLDGTSGGTISGVDACGSGSYTLTMTPTSGDNPTLYGNTNGKVTIQYEGRSGSSSMVYQFDEPTDVRIAFWSSAFSERVTFITPYDNLAAGINSTIVSGTNTVGDPHVWHNNNSYDSSNHTYITWNNVTEIELGITGTGLQQVHEIEYWKYSCDCEPELTLNKTALDTSYSSVGDVLDYEYEVTNTGTVWFEDLVVTDDKIPSISCPVTTLARGESTTCTASYSVVQADIDAGKVTNNAAANADPAAGSLAAATDAETVNKAVIATDDSGSGVSGTASTPVSDVTDGDTINGAPVTLGAGGNATISEVGTWPTGFSLDPATGAVNMFEAVLPGTYTMDYQLCDTESPANCETATITINVPTPAPYSCPVSESTFISKSPHARSINWINFAGVNAAPGSSDTFSVTTPDGRTINGTISVPASEPTGILGSGIPSFGTARRFLDVPGGNLTSVSAALRNNGRTRTAGTLTFSQPVNVVLAEGEASASTERYTATSNGGVWEVIDTYNPEAFSYTGAGTTSLVVKGEDAPTSDGYQFGSGVFFSRETTQLDVSINSTAADGVTAITLGLLIPDTGDAIDSYGDVFNDVSLVNAACTNFAANDPYLGSEHPDGNGLVYSANAAADDTSDTRNDEDTFASFPALTASDTTYTINAPVSNGATSNVGAWIDFDGDGQFQPDEYASASGSSGTATLTWNINGTDADINEGTTYARFRVSNDTMTAASFEGFQSNGEVEDYQITVTPAADLSITKTNTPGVNGEVDQAADTVTSGQDTTYTLVVTNNGPSTVTGAVVTDTPTTGLTCTGTDAVTVTGDGVPAGSFTIADLTGGGITLGTLTDGQSTTLTYSCEVN